MKKLIILLGVAGALCGCATTANYKKAVTSWTGASVDALVSSWGYPAATFQAPNGNTVYEYSNSESYTTSRFTTYQYNPQTGAGYATTYGGDVINFHCKTYFETNAEKKVVKVSFKGNSCKATASKE